MQIIVSMAVRNLPDRPKPLQELYWDHIEEAILAERLGFDGVWGSEHHFSPDCWNPSPLMLMAAIATRTERIRLGTYVLLLPFYNAVRVAEDVAVLDNISRGRVDFAAGGGSAAEEFHTFGVPREQRSARTFEALTVVERCFSGEEFSHKGKYYEFPNVRMTTTPVQAPGPPIWVSSMGQQSATRSARRGYNLAAGGGSGHARYEEALREFGRDPKDYKVCSIPIRVHVAESREKAWDEAEAGLHQVINFYRTRVNASAGSSAAGTLAELPPVGEFRRVPGIGHGGAPFGLGTPDDVLQALAAFRDQLGGKHLTHFGLNFHHPGLDTKIVRRSMQMFAKDVMPAVNSW